MKSLYLCRIVVVVTMIPGFYFFNPSHGYRSLSHAYGYGDAHKLFSLDVSSERARDNKLEFKGLRSGTFQHPLDARATRRLSSIPYVDTLFRNAFHYVEDTFLINNLASALVVGPTQMPQIYNALVQACKILDISPIPDIFVRQNQVPNAYTLAVQGRKPFIVLHSSIVDLLTPEELQAVIAHELGHLKCEHGIWVTVLNVILEGIDLLGDSTRIVAVPLRTLLLQWQRSAEFSCDRAALLVTQDVNVVASVMMKLCGGSKSLVGQLDLNSFLSQADMLTEASKSMPGGLSSRAMELLSTHPIPVIRATELLNWSTSAQYRGLLRRATETKY